MRVTVPPPSPAGAAHLSPVVRELAALARRYFAHDRDGREHAFHVARLALLLGAGLRLEERDLLPLAVGALLHDVGKLTVPADVLEKPGSLTRSEWRLVSGHAAAGADLVGRYVRHPLVRAAVRSHHERVDGSGYPDGLRGERIPLAARIVAVADAYDAMVSARPYSPACSPAAAAAETERCAGSQFDPRCVERLHAVVARDRCVAA